MSDDEVYNVFMDDMYDRERRKVREGYKDDKAPIETVGDLIKRLQNFKDDEPIYFYDSYWGTHTAPFVHYTDSSDFNENDEWVKKDKLIISSYE